MATLGITIKSDFSQASKDLKNFKANSEQTAISVKKFQDSFKSTSIDKFLDKQKRSSAALRATRGAVEASQVEYRQLRNEIERLIKRGIDPQDKSLKRLTSRYNVLQKELNETEKEQKELTRAQMQGAKSSGIAAKAAALGAKALFTVKLAAIAAAGSIIKNTFTIAKMGDEYAKTSRRIGLTAEELQELTFAADRQGVSGEELTKGLEKLNKNVGDLRVGYGSLNTVLKNSNPELLENLKNAKSNTEAWELSVDALNSSSDELERASLAQALFGRAGLKLLTVTEAGTEGIKALRAEARKYGIISNESAKQAEEFVDAQTNLTAAFQGFRNEIGIRLFPALQGLLEISTKVFLKLNAAFEPVEKIIKRIKELDKQFNISKKIFATYAFAAKFAFNLFKVSFGQAARVGLNLTKFMAGYLKDFAILTIENFKDIGTALKNIFSKNPIENAKELLSGLKENFSTFISETAQNAIQFKDDFVRPYKKIAQDFKNLMGILTDAEQNQVDESGKIQEGKTGKTIAEAEKATAAQIEFQKVLIAATFQAAQIASDSIFELAAQNREKELVAANEFTAELAKLDEADKARNKAKLEDELAEAVKSGNTELADEKRRTLKRIELEEKEKAKSRELAKQAFDTNKRFAIAQALVNTGLAVTSALATVVPFPAALIAAGVAAISGAAEVATISNQSFTAQTGTSPEGLTVRGNNRSGQDNMNFKVADGEKVNVVPRGESGGKTLAVNVSIGRETVLSVVQDGIDSGEINILAENVHGLVV